MFNQDKTLQQLKNLVNNSPVRLIEATVLSNEGESCTVQPVGSDLALSGVAFFCLQTKKGKIIAVPRIGSTVFIVCTNHRTTLDGWSVIRTFEPETLMVAVGTHVIFCESDSLVLMGPTSQVDLTPAFLDSMLPTPSQL